MPKYLLRYELIRFAVRTNDDYEDAVPPEGGPSRQPILPR